MSNAEINRELQTLKRIFNLAIENDLTRIDEDDVRRVSLRARERCSLSGALDAYEQLYRDAIEGERNVFSPSASSPQHSHDALTQYATELQAALRAEGSWSMPALPPSIATGVGINVTSAPRVVARVVNIEGSCVRSSRSRSSAFTGHSGRQAVRISAMTA